jgi:hypothetical protein
MINLTYDMLTARIKHGVTLHPQNELNRLGITYKYAVPQSVSDCWHFWDCKNVPENLPPYIKNMTTDPASFLGHGLSQAMVDELSKGEMTPTPAQIAELTHRLKHETWSGFQNLAVQASTAITEQATEIAELKAKLAEVMPLAKFAALTMDSRLLMSHDYGTIDRAIEAGLLSDEGSDGFVLRGIVYKENIEATIEKLLKGEK